MRNSIIVPVFNRSDLTATFLKSVGEYLSPTDELIVVDNNSTDNTELVVKIYSRSYPRKNVIYIKNPENYGFGKANNIGAKEAQGENLIFISNDVIVNGDFITITDKYLTKRPNDAVGARVINWATGWNDRFAVMPFIPYIEGFYMGLRKDKFNIIGGFDENILIDAEDIDVSYRLYLSGVGLAQISLPVFHPHSGSSFSGLSEARINLTMKSIEYLEKKWGKR